MSAVEPGARIPVFAPELVGSDEDYNRAAFEQLAAVEKLSFWFRARNRLIIWALRAHFPEARSLLEIGCGSGYVLAGLRQAFPELRLVGGDSALEALELARGRLPGVELCQLDARRPPFEDEFDLVGAFDVIEHIGDDERALAGISRAARTGGGVLLTVPQHPWLWSLNDEAGRHKRRYTRGDLLAKVRRAGLEPLRVTSFVSLPLPAMVAWRLRWRLRRDRRNSLESFDLVSELHPPSWLNTLLERVLDLELSLIRRGVSFPAGGSLLVVARRR